MLYDLSLEIAYDYESPAQAGRHALRLMPATITGQQGLIAGRFHLSPHPSERHDRLDFFGNAVSDVAYRTAHDALSFKLTARVERTAAPAEFDFSPPLDKLPGEIAAIQSVAPQEPVHFLAPSRRLPRHPSFAAYARDKIDSSMTAAAVVTAIGNALHADMRFDADATTVDTPAHEALERRHGVCQDFSHILIACLRSIGVPAGYVSGFLRTIPPEGRPRLEGADAMHAWVMAWCGLEAGWIEYDPTNAVRVGLDHIVVAKGRDYGDVAPVKGVLRTAGTQSTHHKVDVVPLTNGKPAAAAVP